MSKLRATISMTAIEIHQFLKEGHTLQVATLNSDGSPHLVAMFYALLDDKIAFGTYAKSQKVVNLRRDPRVTVMLEDGDDYNELRGLVIEGVARIIDDDVPLTARVLRAAAARRPADLSIDDGALPLATAAKRVVVVVEPKRIYSWDHRKLDGKQ